MGSGLVFPFLVLLCIYYVTPTNALWLSSTGLIYNSPFVSILVLHLLYCLCELSLDCWVLFEWPKDCHDWIIYLIFAYCSCQPVYSSHFEVFLPVITIVDGMDTFISEYVTSYRPDFQSTLYASSNLQIMIKHRINDSQV